MAPYYPCVARHDGNSEPRSRDDACSTCGRLPRMKPRECMRAMSAWQKLQRFAVGIAVASKGHAAVSKRLATDPARDQWIRVHAYVLSTASFQGALSLAFAKSDPGEWWTPLETHDFQVLEWAIQTIDLAVSEYLSAEQDLVGLVASFGNLVDYWATTHSEPPPDLSVVRDSLRSVLAASEP